MCKGRSEAPLELSRGTRLWGGVPKEEAQAGSCSGECSQLRMEGRGRQPQAVFAEKMECVSACVHVCALVCICVYACVHVCLVCVRVCTCVPVRACAVGEGLQQTGREGG